MAQLAFVRLLSLFTVAATLPGSMCAPVPSAVARRQDGFAFPVQDYADFQISSGTAGDARARAAAVFDTPFANVNLASVSDTVQQNVKAMRDLAEDAETELFNPAIDDATGDTKRALENGKTANKCLKHVAFLRFLEIKLAKAEAEGDSTADIEEDIADRIKKLDLNCDKDAANAGQASLSPLDSDGPSSNVEPVPAPAPAPAPAPVPAPAPAPAPPAPQTPGAAFRERSYADFQISGGVGGDAAAEAALVIVAPFAGRDLSLVTDDEEEAVANMRVAAENAELDNYNPAIEAASGATKAALQVGKDKNKVLKHTIFLQLLQIRLAKATASGDDTASIEADIVEREQKLQKNVDIDIGNAGEASLPAPGI